MNKIIPEPTDPAEVSEMAEAAARETVAQKNLDLALANDPRSASPLEASKAFMELTSMYSHRGDGIPTQYVHSPAVADAAHIMWLALITALRTPPVLRASDEDGTALERLRAYATHPCRAELPFGQDLRAIADELEAVLEVAKEALEQAARWFEEYAVDHEVKARQVSDSYEQASRLDKAKRNQERADYLRAALQTIGAGQ